MAGAEFDRLYESAMVVDGMCTDGGVVVVVNGAGKCEVVKRRLENVTTARMSKVKADGKVVWVGAAVWTSEEMLRYVYMSAHERKVYRGLKLTFRGTGEFE